MKRFTANDVLRMVSENAEPSSVPASVLAVLKREDGKLLTKRLLAKLPGGESNWRIRHVAGMTYLDSMDSVRSGGSSGYSFFLAYAEKNVTIDVPFVLDRNAAYFGARETRNARRAQVDPGAARTMADALNAVADARAKLALAEEALDELTETDSPFGPDRYFWKGLVEGEKR